jgi:hypothetical protein
MTEMSINDDVLPVKQLINELFWELSRECDYYKSGDYDRDADKSRELDKRLKKRLGKKQYKKIWWYVFEQDSIIGKKLAGLQGSCYRKGFNDALMLVGEIEKAKKGLPNIFN